MFLDFCTSMSICLLSNNPLNPAAMKCHEAEGLIKDHADMTRCAETRSLSFLTTSLRCASMRSACDGPLSSAGPRMPSARACWLPSSAIPRRVFPLSGLLHLTTELMTAGLPINQLSQAGPFLSSRSRSSLISSLTEVI